MNRLKYVVILQYSLLLFHGGSKKYTTIIFAEFYIYIILNLKVPTF